jgi:hypothetical protein
VLVGRDRGHPGFNPDGLMVFFLVNLLLWPSLPTSFCSTVGGAREVSTAGATTAGIDSEALP